MCTVLVSLRPDDRWPLVVGADRDERLDRAFDPPGRWWPEAPGVLAGRDRLGGGSWLGVNDDGVVATIVNGLHEIGPSPGKASRGELVLRALRERDAASAAGALAALDPGRYRGFTVLVADRDALYVVRNAAGRIAAERLEPGAHLATPHGLERAEAPPPGDWEAWNARLRVADVPVRDGFGTVARALVAIPADRAQPYHLDFTALAHAS